MVASLLVGVALGCFAWLVVEVVDTLMDYGHPLDWVRYKKAMKIAKKHGIEQIVKIELDQMESISSFEERLNHMDEMYWRIAMYDKGFVGWLCKKCMCIRTTVYLSPVLIVLFWAGPVSLLIVPVAAFVAAALNKSL